MAENRLNPAFLPQAAGADAVLPKGQAREALLRLLYGNAERSALPPRSAPAPKRATRDARRSTGEGRSQETRLNQKLLCAPGQGGERAADLPLFVGPAPRKNCLSPCMARFGRPALSRQGSGKALSIWAADEADVASRFVVGAGDKLLCARKLFEVSSIDVYEYSSSYVEARARAVTPNRMHIQIGALLPPTCSIRQQTSANIYTETFALGAAHCTVFPRIPH